MSSKIERLKKEKKNVFILPTPTLTPFFGTFSLTSKKIISYFKYLQILCDKYNLKNINDCHKSD